MVDQDALMKEITSNVAAEVADSVRAVVADSLEQHMKNALRKSLAESEFYRRLSDEMLSGLQKIYKEIHTVSKESAEGDKSQVVVSLDHSQANKLFSEASQQLDEIMTTTLEATENIMSKTEELFDKQQEAAQIISQLQSGESPAASLGRLGEINEENGQAFTSIMEALSFQDLTGQRMKKVVTALGKIESTVFELYVSAGLMMKTSNEDKQKDFEELSEETRRTANDLKEGKGSTLTGPSLDAASQSDVDDLLANLGL